MHEAIIALHLSEMRKRLDKAAEIGRAADACATTQSFDAAVDVALDVEQYLYEANTLLNAVSLIRRISMQASEAPSSLR